MQRHGDRILDIEKITLLFAVLVILTMALKEADDTILLHLRKTFMHERAHVALVILVRAEDVEIFQSDNFVQKAGALGVQIKQMLRVTIHVQRTQFVELRVVVFHARRAVAVSRGG